MFGLEFARFTNAKPGLDRLLPERATAAPFHLHEVPSSPPHPGATSPLHLEAAFLLQRTALEIGSRHISQPGLRPWQQQERQVLLTQLRQPSSLAPKGEATQAQVRKQASCLGAMPGRLAPQGRAYRVMLELKQGGPPALLYRQPAPEIAIYLQPGTDVAVADELHQWLSRACEADRSEFIAAYLDRPTAYKGVTLRVLEA